MSFAETLARVLDPEGVCWDCGDLPENDPANLSLIQLRIDVPLRHVADAVEQMEAGGWQFYDQPDEADDPQQRLFFRRVQNLLPDTKTKMLTDALKVVFAIEGARLWTWIIVDDENDL